MVGGGRGGGCLLMGFTWSSGGGEWGVAGGREVNIVAV